MSSLTTITFEETIDIKILERLLANPDLLTTWIDDNGVERDDRKQLINIHTNIDSGKLKVNYKFSKNAASKPKMDCETVLEKNGFKNLGFKQSNHSSSAIGAIISFFGITKGLFLLPRKSVFCMQYPLSKFFGYITTIVSLKKCTLIIIIHDVKYLMGKSKDLKGEMAKFNKADFIIVVPTTMTKTY